MCANEIKHKSVGQLLKKNGVKQKAVAAVLDVSPQAVNQVVLGQRATPRIRKAIASAVEMLESEIWPDGSLKKEAA